MPTRARPWCGAAAFAALTLLLSHASPTRGASDEAADLAHAAPLSDYAKRTRPPALPPPASLVRRTGFSAAELDLFRDVLSGAERGAAARLSEQVMQSPLASVIRHVAAHMAVADQQQTDRALPREGDLFTYTLPNDPIIWLGTAKSYDGTVTALPRLARGAFAPPKAGPDAAAAEPPQAEDDWILAHPEQACTSGLAYTLTAQGSMFSDIESLPAPASLGVHQMDLLAEIERRPSPFLHTAAGGGEPAAASEPGQDAAAGQAARPPGAASGGPPDPFVRIRQEPRPLAEFLGTAQAFLGPSHALLYALMGQLKTIVAELPSLQRTCEGAGNHWSGDAAKAHASSDIELFSCTDAAGRQVGLGLRLVTGGGDYPRAVVAAAADPATGLGAELRLDFDREAVALRSLAGTELSGPELLWEFSGAAIGLNFNVPPARREAGVAFDVYEWHTSGGVKLVGHRRGGQSVGDERTWYASGALAGEVTFGSDGRMTAYREWYETYRPAEETLLTDGKVSGLRRWWHENGAPAGLVAYQGGDPHGAATLWYDDGAKGVALTFRRGEPDGAAAWWYEDGSPLFTGTFVDGKPDGLQKVYLPTGGELSERRYRRGQPDGVWTVYDAHGKALREVAFKGGQKDGKALLRYREGQPFVELSWKGGLLEGPLRSFYRDGQLASTCLYEKDQLTQFTRWFPTGETALEGKVVDPARGQVAFTVFRQDGQTALECAMSNFEMDTCKIFNTAGEEARLPPDQEMINAATSRGETKAAWQPCGSVKRRFNFDALINNRGRQFFATFEGQGVCGDRPQGAALSCLLSLGDTDVKIDTCAVEGQVEGGAVTVRPAGP